MRAQPCITIRPTGKDKTDFDRPNTRAVKIINNVLYASLNGPDGTAMDQPAGIYRFVDKLGNALPLPRQANATIELVFRSRAYTENAGFDMNPEQTIAYMADTMAGVQKYVKSGGSGNWPIILPSRKPFPPPRTMPPAVSGWSWILAARRRSFTPPPPKATAARSTPTAWCASWTPTPPPPSPPSRNAPASTGLSWH